MAEKYLEVLEITRLNMSQKCFLAAKKVTGLSWAMSGKILPTG